MKRMITRRYFVTSGFRVFLDVQACRIRSKRTLKREGVIMGAGAGARMVAGNSRQRGVGCCDWRCYGE